MTREEEKEESGRKKSASMMASSNYALQRGIKLKLACLFFELARLCSPTKFEINFTVEYK